MRLIDSLQAFLRKAVPKPLQELAAFVRFVFITVVNTVLLLFVYVVGVAFTFVLVRLLHVDIGFGKGNGRSRWTPFEKIKSERSYYRQF